MNTTATNNLERKLSALETRYEDLQRIMADPETANDPALLQRFGREYASISNVVETYRALQQVRQQLSETEVMLGDGLDDEMRALVYDEMEQLRAREAELTNEVQVALLPRDIMDDRNAIVTIQAGAGGDEAGLFAADLFRMYLRYADAKRWSVEVLDENESGIGGYKEVVFEVRGRGAYARMKYEGGTHRV